MKKGRQNINNYNIDPARICPTNGELFKGRTFKSMKEIKDAFWPNVPLEELIPEMTDEEIQVDLKRIIKNARRETKRISSKKLPI